MKRINEETVEIREWLTNESWNWNDSAYNVKKMWKYLNIQLIC